MSDADDQRYVADTQRRLIAAQGRRYRERAATVLRAVSRLALLFSHEIDSESEPHTQRRSCTQHGKLGSERHHATMCNCVYGTHPYQEVGHKCRTLLDRCRGSVEPVKFTERGGTGSTRVVKTRNGRPPGWSILYLGT